MTPLTLGEGNDHAPHWTPDGEHVIYASEQLAFELYRRRADGSGEAERLFTRDQDKEPSSVAPAGSVVAFTEMTDGIWMLPLDQRRPEPFLRTPSAESDARFSPAGEWVAYQSNRSGRREVYVRAYRDAGANVLVSTDGGVDERWAPSGRELFYRRQNSILSVLITNRHHRRRGGE